LRFTHRLHRDDVGGQAGVHHRRQKGLGKLRIGDEHRPRSGIVEDMDMVALGIGGVGRHCDAARRHDREIGNAPFRPVFGDQRDPVAGGQTKAAQPLRHQADLTGHLAPAERMPVPFALGPQERCVAALVGPLKEQAD
jgi:hypothetical protein